MTDRSELRAEIARQIQDACPDPHEALLVLAQLTGSLLHDAPFEQKAELFGLVILVIARNVPSVS